MRTKKTPARKVDRGNVMGSAAKAKLEAVLAGIILRFLNDVKNTKQVKPFFDEAVGELLNQMEEKI